MVSKNVIIGTISQINVILESLRFSKKELYIASPKFSNK